jgi:23S rRNA pseudouridine1911/1915/1917 synthase
MTPQSDRRFVVVLYDEPLQSQGMQRTLLDQLTRQFPSAKKQTLKRMVSAGRVLVNRQPAKKLAQLLADDDVVAVLEASAAKRTGTAPRMRTGPDFPIVHEDADILVVDKPEGLLTSTVPGERRPTLLAKVAEYLSLHDPRARVGLIHRLDRDASGLLVFSKNPASFRALKQAFLRHEVERVYAAIVAGRPKSPAGLIESRLIERADGTVRSTRENGKGQWAVTEYETVQARELPGRGWVTLLKVTLHTGRKHQIRAHLAEHGMPIVGDTLYNTIDQYTTKIAAPWRLMLAAVRLAVTHPRTGRRLAFDLPLPPAFAEITGDESQLRWERAFPL